MSEQAIGGAVSPFFGRDTAAPPMRGSFHLTRRHLAVAAVALVIAGAAAYGVQWWHVGRFVQTTDDAYVGGDVTVIAPKVAGFIAMVAVIDNQRVHAGDLLLKLDDRDYRAALEKADAAVAGGYAAIGDLDATRVLQLSRIAEARAAIHSAQAETLRTDEDEGRYRQLASEGVASRQSFERADAAYKEALADTERATDALASAQAQLDIIASQRNQAVAALQSAEADRDQARLNLSYTELRAPVDGEIGNRSAQTGAFASVGSQLISLVPAQGLWVDANFKEGQLARMHPGQPVTIEADALPGRVLHGHVVSLAPATGAQFSLLPADNATGNFTKIVQRVPVRIALDGDASELGALRPGLSVEAAIDTRGIAAERP